MIKLSKKNRVIILVISLYLALLSSISPAVKVFAKNEKDLTISIDYGIDKFLKYGRYNEFRVTLKNGPKELNGRLQLILLESNDKRVMYEEEVNLLAYETKTVPFVVPIMQYSQDVSIRVVDNNKKIVNEKTEELKVNMDFDSICIGVLSDEVDKLSYFSTTTSKLFNINEKILSDDYRMLDILDVIVMNNYNSEKLSNNQSSAIKEWVDSGGTLVIGTGDSYNKTLNKNWLGYIDASTNGLEETKSHKLEENKTVTINQDVLEGEVLNKENILNSAEIAQVVINDVINNMLNVDNVQDKAIIQNSLAQEKNFDQELMGGISVATIKKRFLDLEIKNAQIIIEEDEAVLIQMLNRGKGKVIVFSFDLGYDNFKINSISKSIISVIRDNFSQEKNLQLENNGRNIDIDWNINDALNHLGPNKLPKVAKYIIILWIYMVFTGPVLYLILRKRDKRQYMWVLVPLSSIIFAVIIYGMGSKTRVKEIFVSYVSMITMDSEDNASEKIVLGLTSPYNKKYSMTLDKAYNIKKLNNRYRSNYYSLSNDNSSDAIKYKTAIRSEGDSTVVELKDYTAFENAYFSLEHSYYFDGKVETKLTNYDGLIDGYLVNNLGYNLNHASILSDGVVIDLGSIDNNTKIEVKEKEKRYVPNVDFLYFDKIIAQLAGETGSNDDMDVNQRKGVLQYFYEEKLASPHNVSYLIGFIDLDEDSLKGVIEKNNPMKSIELKSYGISMIIIPIEVAYTKEQSTYIPDIKSYMNIMEGNGDVKNSYMYSDYLVAEYNFPKKDKITKISYQEELNINIPPLEYGSFNGEVQFYNNKTKVYDMIFTNKIKGEQLELDNYVDENNRILIRYEVYPVAGDNNAYIIPHLSAIKEGE